MNLPLGTELFRLTKHLRLGRNNYDFSGYKYYLYLGEKLVEFSNLKSLLVNAFAPKFVKRYLFNRICKRMGV